MPHNLEQYEDGSASFVSAREVPWHRLGRVFDRPMTLEEAVTAARAGYPVWKVPVWAEITTENGPSLVQIEDRAATVRPHPEKPGEYLALGVVGTDYTVVTNWQAFSFLDDLPRLHPEIVSPDRPLIETLGVLGKGERAFATLKLPREITVAGEEDTTNLYVAIVTSHNGSLALTGCVTPVRMVCQNTVTAGLRRAVRTWRFHHTGGIKGRMAEARQTLDLTYAYADTFEAEAREMLVAMTTDQQARALHKVWDLPKDAGEQTIRNRDAKIENILDLAAGDPAAGTAWGLWNGYVEWVDYFKNTRVIGGDATKAKLTKAASICWGPLAEDKERAFRVIRDYALA